MSVCVHHETGELMIPTNLTYFTPQRKRLSTASSSPPSTVVVAGSGKRSPLNNKNVQQINNEEEASVLSRYPFHGNRALPSSRDLDREAASGSRRGNKRWSFMDLNNNPVGRGMGASPAAGPSEHDGMLDDGDRVVAEKAYKIQMKVLQKGGSSGSGRSSQKRQLTSVRSHSSNNRIYYKSPPMRRYSNVYDYTYMSDPNLKAIYEDSD